MLREQALAKRYQPFEIDHTSAKLLPLLIVVFKNIQNIKPNECKKQRCNMFLKYLSLATQNKEGFDSRTLDLKLYHLLAPKRFLKIIKIQRRLLKR